MQLKTFLLICFLSFGMGSSALSQTKKVDFPAIKMKDWKKVPVISGRVATENDIKKGLAVFNLDNAGLNHKACEIELPKMAYLNHTDNTPTELIIVIQAEISDNRVVIGYRRPNGGCGVCFFEEIYFLNDVEIEDLIKLSK